MCGVDINWETQRLESLRRLEIVDSDPEPQFDEIVELAADICGVPIALISLVEEDRQWFKAVGGLDAIETPRSQAFCAYTILDSGPLVVPDATLDERFADNPLVTGDPNIRLYAGVPVRSPDNFPLGTLCLIDSRPRSLTNQQLRHLQILASQVELLLHLRQELISARKQKQLLDAALQESNESRRITRALLDNSRNLLGLLTPQGTVLDMNQTALRAVGVEQHEVSGTPFSSTVWWSHSKETQKQLQDSIQRATAGEGCRFNATHPTADGDLIEVDVTITPVFSDAGAVTHLVSEGVDITEYLRIQRAVMAAKQAAEESELRFRNIADSATVLIFTTDAKGQISWANQPFLAYAGMSLAELQNQRWTQIVHSDDTQQATNLQESGDRPEYGFECRILRYDNVYYWHLLKLAPRLTKDGQLLGYVGIFVDVDASRVARHAMEISRGSLAKTQEELRRTNAVLEQVTNALSDEIIPPMTSLQKLAHLAQAGSGEHLLTNSREHLQNIQQHTSLLLSMLGDLQRYYHAGKVAEEVSVVDVEQIIHDIWTGIDAPSGFLICVGAMPSVLTDRCALAMVFHNLLENAVIHAGKDTGQVSVQCDQTEGLLRFRISDRGPGVAPEHQDRIFDLFRSPVRSSNAKNNGTGLALVRKLVERRGGKIHVEPFLNDGATFVFSWPIGPRETAPSVMPRI